MGNIKCDKPHFFSYMIHVDKIGGVNATTPKDQALH